MTVLERPVEDREDVPAPIPRSRSLADRAFQWLLTSSSVVVLAILLATVLFLAVKGLPALRLGGIGIFFDPTWAPDAHHFGVMSLLIGSFAIALVAIVIAVPVSVAIALMINEYSPTQTPSLADQHGRSAGHHSEHRLRLLGTRVRLRHPGRAGKVDR